MLNNRPIIVKMLSTDFDFNKEVLQTIPIWVKYPNLPLNCWEMELLSRISSALRVPLYADECITRVKRISYAQVLVEMDVARKLPQKIKMEDPNGRDFKRVKYEWVSEYCSKCIQVRHKCHAKDKNKGKKVSRLVQKWQGKSSKSTDAGTSKNINEPIAQQTYWKKIEGSWQQVTIKSASKRVVLSSTSQVMATNNGFESLATTDENLNMGISHRVQGKGSGDTNPKIVK